MIKEIEGDLFMHLEGRVPVHCIAADHRMGAGIAVPMARRFALHEALDGYGALLDWPSCVYANGVLNLVTKRLSFHKPKLSDFARALEAIEDHWWSIGQPQLEMRSASDAIVEMLRKYGLNE